MAENTPAIYPKPDPIRLGRIMSVDTASRTITVAGDLPAELLEAVERERLRLNLTGRIMHYTAACLTRVMPHFGTRPKHIPPRKWNDLEERVRLLPQLPPEAPEHARLAFMALKAIHRMSDELVAADDYSEHIERALCWALDLGQLLERSQAQIDHGATVDAGRRSRRAVRVASKAKGDRRNSKSEVARQEFIRRMNGNTNPRMKTATLQNMAAVKDNKGRPKFGSYRTLVRYAKNWS